MPCRYLQQRAEADVCRACEPQRKPTREELRARCLGEPSACPFHRFFRAAGRPLRIEDFHAWQKRAKEPLRPRKVPR